MRIRKAEPTDIEIWALMRNKLWPGKLESHKEELGQYFDGDSIDVVETLLLEIAAHDNPAAQKIVGFIELNIRNFAEGSRLPRVPYVEAWYVDERHQGEGYGRLLMKAAEDWAQKNGFDELASDTEATNSKSIAIHAHLGFRETDRIVCFLKKLE